MASADAVSVPRRLAVTGLALLVAAIMTLTVLHLSVRALDDYGQRMAERLITAEINGRLSRLGTLVLDNSWWDIAVENLFDRYDADWADTNVGNYLIDTFDLSATAVLDLNADVVARFAADPAADSLLGEVLASTALAAMIARAGVEDGAPQPVAGLIAPSQGFAMTAVSAVVREGDAEAQPRGYLVVLRRFAASDLASLAAMLGIEGVALSPTGADGALGRITLPGPAGEAVGQVTFRPAHRGRELIRAVAPVLLLGLAVVLGLILVIFRQFQHQNRALRAANAGLERAIAEQTQARHRLEESEERFRILADVTGEAVFLHADGKFIDCNATACHMFGRRREAIVGGHVRDLVSPESLETVMDHIAAGADAPYEAVGRRQSGAEFPIEIHGRNLVLGGRTLRVTAVRDLSREKAADLHLRRLSQAVEKSPSAIVLCDPEGRIRYTNPAFAAGLGRPVGELQGRPLADLVASLAAGGDGRSAAAFMTALTRHGSWDGELALCGGAGVVRWYDMRLKPLRDGAGAVDELLVICADVTERRERDARIHYLSNYDSLTGLPNRNGMHDSFERAVAFARESGTKVAVLLVDLDGFKAVNEGAGHGFGDRLLVAASDRLRDAVRPLDNLFRLGGDEFLVLLNGVAGDGSVRREAEKLRRAFREPLQVDDHEVPMSLSIGVTVFPDHGRDLDDLLGRAESALHGAKRDGRNAVVFFNAVDRKAADRRRDLERRLRGALAGGELSVVYQPIVEAQSGDTVAAEALLRWTNPALGPVSPAEFIPIAEDGHLIDEIGAWVLERAVSEAVRWPGALQVAVNVSARQFRRRDFPAFVAHTLERHGLAPDRLTLEVTETLMLGDYDQARQWLSALRGLGVRLALDDFGTGFSALGYLKDLPFDRLKIDRAFVKDLTREPRSQALARAMIDMAHSLGLTVVGEGVEDGAQLTMLRQLGCQLIQGYLTGRPMPEAALSARISRSA